MQTGLAIGDLAGIVSNAALLRLETQIYLHDSLERIIPDRFLKKIQQNLQTHRVYIEQRPNWMTMVRLTLLYSCSSM